MTTQSAALPDECFISVDVETSGPIPAAYSLLSIGACLVTPSRRDAPEAQADTFYCTLKPLVAAGCDPTALRITGFSLEDLAQTGKDPSDAMLSFDAWIKSVAEPATPVFVGLNAAFDWSFVNDYFHRFLGRNPFGIAALDIKSMYLGATGCAWADTRSSRMSEALGVHEDEMAHHALDDAKAQARLFTAVREAGKSKT